MAEEPPLPWVPQAAHRVSIDIEEPLFTKWRDIARSNKRLHEASRAHYKRLADTSAIASIVLGIVGGLLNVVLGVIDTPLVAGSAVNIGQIVLGATGLVSTGILSVSKQLGWEQKHHLHEEYTARYSELARMINSESVLIRYRDGTYASVGDLIRALKSELDRIEDHAPPIPGFLEVKLGLKSTSTNGD